MGYTVAYAARARQAGVPLVTEHCFGEDVPHTAAFYKQREKYVQLVKDFLDLR